MFCPECGTQNSDDNLFCQNCGGGFSELNKPKSSSSIQTPSTQTRQPAPQPRRDTSVTVPATSNFLETNGISIWGPFAGYGNRRDHKGWLVPGRAERKQDLITQVEDKFKERKVENAQVIPKVLSVKGILEEKRPYYLMMRGVATVGLYVTNFGKDLFVSIASYIKPPISKFRVILLGVIILISFFGMTWWSNSLSNSVSGSVGLFGGPSINFDRILFLVCFAGPFITIAQIALIIFIPVSIYKWLKERDFWALLRMPVNEFNEDDLMAMEKAVEQTVRFALDDIGIPTDELLPITRGERQRII